jgi:hypothetical protein
VVKSVEELATANLLEVFGERDPGRRRAAIAELYAADVVFADPDEVVTGHAELDRKAQQILDGAPGFVFTPQGPVGVNHDVALLAWVFGPEGQEPVVSGVDVSFVSDGRIARVYTFLTAQP